MHVCYVFTTVVIAMATLVCLSDKIMVSTDDGSYKVVLLCCMSFSS